MLTKTPELNLFTMLSYMRPDGGRHTQKFANRFIRPLMGDPDEDGNFVLSIGGNPNRVAFMAHYDTVHFKSGKQKVHINSRTGMISAPQSDCLGADCTTGVWLILNMIHEQVPGLYVIHAAEEVGCVGSKALVDSNPDWLDTIDFAISFDRKGYDSIVTHQLGRRTASDAFAESLAAVLGMDMEPDSTGAFTDSNEYSSIVPECTNLSVGYFDQHSHHETQDYNFAVHLLDQLLSADFSGLVKSRVPTDFDDYWAPSRWDHFRPAPKKLMVKIIEDYPEEVASLLKAYGITTMDLFDEFGIHPTADEMEQYADELYGLSVH